MKKLLILLSLLIIALFVISCAPKEGANGEEGALAGQAVSISKLNPEQKKAYNTCSRDCYYACYDKIKGTKACTSEKISLSLNKQERLSAVKPELTKVDLPTLLADGTVAGNQYTQKLVFNDQTSSYIDYLENDNDVQDNFFYLKNGQQFAQYTLTFTASLLLYSESSITGAAVSGGGGGGGGGSGSGFLATNILENSKIKLLGEEFTVIKASPYTTEKGLEIVMKSSTGKLFLLKDNDMTNDIPDSTEMEIDYEKIDGATVTIKGEYGNNPKIDSITIKMVAEDDFYVAVGEKLSTAIKAANEEKEILFTNNWDLKLVSYDGGANKGIIEIGKFCE